MGALINNHDCGDGCEAVKKEDPKVEIRAKASKALTDVFRLYEPEMSSRRAVQLAGEQLVKLEQAGVVLGDFEVRLSSDTDATARRVIFKAIQDGIVLTGSATDTLTDMILYRLENEGYGIYETRGTNG